MSDEIRKQVLLKEPKSWSDLSRFVELCDATHVMSIRTWETKFENMLEEIKDLKKELQIKQTNVVQGPVYNDKQTGYQQN